RALRHFGHALGLGVYDKQHLKDIAAASKRPAAVPGGGGNDGLATVVPHGEDALYRARKTTARRKGQLLAL
mgnify:CR=1